MAIVNIINRVILSVGAQSVESEPWVILNNIAPPGFRVPTAAEWEEERLTWATNDRDGAFGSVLKLTAGGYRNYSNGSLINVGSYGRYWSSTVNGTLSRALRFSSSSASMGGDNQVFGLSVRCIKDETYTGEAFTGGIFNGLEYQFVTNPTTGRTWLDRNLGATRVATAYNDSDAYGDLYQWGRLTDGHEKRTSSTTAVLSATDVPGHGDFILSPSSPYDWRNPQNDNLWQII
jgi:hypothetical protein